MSWFLSCFSNKPKKNRQLQEDPNSQFPIKSQLKQNEIEEKRLSRYKNVSKIKLPSKLSTHSVIRTFQMDYDDGISHNLTINTFNYKPKQQNSDVMYYKHFGHNIKELSEKEDEKPIQQREKSNHRKLIDIHEEMQQQPTGF